MKKALALVASALLALPATALADQCAWVSKDDAREAVSVLIKRDTYTPFCAPCGDEHASSPVTIESLSFAPVKGGKYYEVSINGKGIDLAYAYSNAQNVGLAVGCGAKDVPNILPGSTPENTPPDFGAPPSLPVQAPPSEGAPPPSDDKLER